MNDVINKMYEKKKRPYPKSIAQKFVNNSEHADIIIVVEGISDKDFYKNTNIKILNEASYIFAEEYANIQGKKAVIDSYFTIRELSKRKIFKNSIVFIVDKDFFGINWTSNAYKNFVKDKGAKVEDIDNFNILNCHSHESYFILENNLKMIFKLLHLEDKLNEFEKIFKDNLEDFSEYFAYKSILVDENPNYTDRCNVNRWINFDFKFKYGNIIFNRVAMQREIENMKNQISKNEKKEMLEKQHLEMKQKFKNHPELLRGHNLYDFLECYLEHYGNSLKENGKYNDKIIKEMEIPLNIKVLKFGIGKYKLDEI